MFNDIIVEETPSLTQTQQNENAQPITCVNTQDLSEIVQTIKTLMEKQTDSDAVVDAVKCLAKTVNQQSDLMKELLEQNATIIGELKKIKVCMRSTEKSGETVMISSYKCKSSLPLKSYIEILDFEKTMDLEDVQKYIISIGGNTLQRMIANIVEVVYSIDVQVQTTWKGKRSSTGGWSKYPMNETKLPQIIIEICHAAFQRCSNAEVVAAFQKYMMHGTDRMRKTVNNNTTTTTINH